MKTFHLGNAIANAESMYHALETIARMAYTADQYKGNSVCLCGLLDTIRNIADTEAVKVVGHTFTDNVQHEELLDIIGKEN